MGKEKVLDVLTNDTTAIMLHCHIIYARYFTEGHIIFYTPPTPPPKKENNTIT